jgi:membrane protease YdiL (CAAX protease family)
MQAINYRWIRIAIYFAIALSSSILFRLNYIGGYGTLKLPGVLAVYKSLLEGAGPFLGALIVMRISGRKSNISFLGNPGRKSLLMLAVPVLLFFIIGVNNDRHINVHFYGLNMGIWIALYGVLEETGWRGYLQDELKDYPPLVKYSIVGVIWYAWHLTFLGHTTVLNELVILVILVLASYGIGLIADRTRSILAAACFHILGNILGLSTELQEAVPAKTRIWIVIACAVCWWALLRIKPGAALHRKANEQLNGA